MPPLIVTARLDDASSAALDDLRRRHFPPARNHLRAHLTLFHRLPGGEERRIRADLAAAAGARSAAVATVGPPFSLGRGVAFAVDCPALLELRAALAEAWAEWLGPQDRAWHRPHVTVQNKAEPAEARALLDRLTRDVAPWHGEIRGVEIWRYLGGPWAPVASVPLGERYCR